MDNYDEREELLKYIAVTKIQRKNSGLGSPLVKDMEESISVKSKNNFFLSIDYAEE